MLETLKKLTASKMISLDDENIFNFTNNEDFTIESTELYQSEDSELLLLQINENYLIAHTLQDDPRYFIFEECAIDAINNLDDIPSEMEISKGEEMQLFEQQEVYSGLMDGDQEICVYEYECRDERLISAITILVFDSIDHLKLQGFEIDEKSIVI